MIGTDEEFKVELIIPENKFEARRIAIEVSRTLTTC